MVKDLLNNNHGGENHMQQGLLLNRFLPLIFAGLVTVYLITKLKVHKLGIFCRMRELPEVLKMTLSLERLEEILVTTMILLINKLPFLLY